MNFQDSITVCFTKFATFSGRARRSEFWWFFGFTYLIGLVISAMSPMAALVVSLVLAIPLFAVGSRRLHDTGKTGWWQVIPVIPALISLVKSLISIGEMASGNLNVGDIFLSMIIWTFLYVLLELFILFLMSKPSERGTNKYGDEIVADERGGILTPSNTTISFELKNATSTNSDDKFTKLERIHDMLKKGILSNEEFADLKSKIMKSL